MTYGVDYFEVFSFVLDYTTVSIMLATAAQYGWKKGLNDVKNALVIAVLTEEIYPAQPKRLLYVCGRKFVHKLNCAMHESKKAFKE